MEVAAIKENGVIVDMTPAAMLQHNSTIVHAQSQHQQQQQQQQQQQALTLCNLKDNSNSHSNNNSPGRQTPGSDSGTSAVSTATTLAGNSCNSMSPTNLTTTAAAGTTFRCERCDNFETNSRASLLLHVVQCLSSPVRLKTEEPDVENLSMAARNEQQQQKLGNSLNLLKIAKLENGNVSLVSGANAQALATVAAAAAAAAASNGVAAAAAAAGSPNASSASSRKVFECDVCNMKFSNGANMRRHKMRHTGVKPYECRVCQKRFFRKDHLAEHFTTHTKTLPYHCPICNRGFQRQIAMRAHFQNEHVGQHDLVKTCPLCSYRAGSMKSLRIHFFNRHGIDLDNPGPGGGSSLLLALESQASQVAAAAAAASFVPGLTAAISAAAAASNAVNNNANNANSALAANLASHQSDSGESMRSMENATPPMHFLTPHVEISTLPENGAEIFNGHHAAGLPVDASKPRDHHRRDSSVMDASTLENHMDCNPKTLPSSTSNSAGVVGGALAGAPTRNHHDNHITPSISLIPIKQQEPIGEDLTTDNKKSLPKIVNNNNNSSSHHHSNGSSNNINSNSNSSNHNLNGETHLNGGSAAASGDHNENDFSLNNNNINSNNNNNNNRITSPLIKVSPLKSLLREDLKRRICAKANNRISRSSASALENNNNNVLQSVVSGSPTPPAAGVNTSTPICNGTITSTGQESDIVSLNRKQILTCLFCGIEFPDETLYFLHKGCHCESNPWKCNICGEQCNNVYEFNAHLLSKSHQ